MKTNTSVLAAILLLSSATAFAANGNGRQQRRSLMPRPGYLQRASFTVEGQGHTKIKPRWGHTSLTLQKKATSREAALRQVNEQANALEPQLKRTLGRTGSIETSRVSVQREWANGAHTGKFIATKSIQIKARTSKTGLDKLGQAIEQASGAGANVSGQYYRAEPSQVTRAQGTAKSRAYKSAERQAKQIAKTAGFNPNSVELVEVTPIGAQTGGGVRSFALESAVARGGQPDGSTNLTVSKQDVSAGIQAVFTAHKRVGPIGPIQPPVIRPLHNADGQ